MSQAKLALTLLLTLTLTSLASAAEIQWLRSYSDARQQAKETGKPILLHFYSNNCPPCKMLDTRAFKDQGLIEGMSHNVIPVKINVDDNRELADQFEIHQWPTDLYLFPNGSELYRTVSPQDPTVYRELLSRVALRNRDWVVQQNAQYLALQRRNAADNERETPVAEGVETARTPSQDVAPGQAAPPSVSDLGNYPTPQYSKPNTTTPAFANQSSNGRMHLASTRPGIPGANEEESQRTPTASKGNRYKNGPNATAKANRNASIEAQDPSLPPVVNAEQHRRSPFFANANAPAPRSGPSTDSLSIENPYALQARPSTPAAGPRVPSFEPSLEEQPTHTTPVAATKTENDAENMRAHALNSFAQTTNVAFDGNCPVALGMESQWRPGSANFGVRHRGRIYHCESTEAREKFLADPDKFAAVFSGYDIVEFLESGKFVEGKREYGCWFRDQVFLFAKQETCERFFLAKQAYIDEMNRVQESAGRIAERTTDGVRR